MGDKLRRAKQWYTEQPRHEQLIYAAVAFILLAILLNLALTGYVWVESAKEGLSIHLEFEEQRIELGHAQSTDLRFDIGVSNAPFCTATCVYTVTDHRTGEVIAQGEETLRTQVTRNKRHEYTAPSSGRYQAPMQLTATCTNHATALCQRANDTSIAATSATIHVDFTEEDQALYEELQTSLATYNEQTPVTLNELQAISDVRDTRARSTAVQASQEQTTLRRHREELASATSQDDLQRVEQLLSNLPARNAIRAYEELRAAERRAVNAYEDIQSQQALIDALLSITNTTQQARLANNLRAATNAHDSFSTQNPTRSEEAFAELLTTTQELLNEHNSTTHATAQALANSNYAERTMACTLKDTTCPQPPSNTSTFEEAVSLWQRSCEELAKLEEVLQEAQRSYEQQVRSNQSSQATQQEILSTRNQTNYNQTALREAARNGTLLTTNESQRLAAQLTTSEQTTRLRETHCPVISRQSQLPTQTLQATLPTPSNATTPYEPVAFSQRECCNHLTCGACEEETHAILFVHGHAFAQSTPPESSLQGFERLAQALQEQAGVYYAGRIYPRQETRGIHQGIPGPVSLSTTYYYNSYAEQGENLLIAQKDYNLETFAIRLRESIDATRQATGATQVTIIAHSMGGLVTRSYLDIFGTQHVRGVIMIGTPNQGITGRTARACPIIGSARSCEDMSEGSVFLQGLPASTGVPTLTIAGVGCAGAYDGVIQASSVELPEANNQQINGTCSGTNEVLHNNLLRPNKHPEVLALIQEFLEQP